MMPIIDVHTHISNEERYKGYFAKAGKLVGKCLVLHWFPNDLNQLLKFIEKKANLFLVASVDMDGKVSSQLEKIEDLFKHNKAVGIKLYPGYQHFYPSDKAVYSVARLCEKYNKPLIFHSGDVYDFRGPEAGALLQYSHPMHIDALAKEFPKLKIVIAHFGFPYFMETANVVSKNKNVYTEISGTINDEGNVGELAKQYAEDLKRAFRYFKSIKTKIMFGTDYVGDTTPLNQVQPYIDLVKIIFSKVEQKRVFHALAEELFFKS